MAANTFASLAPSSPISMAANGNTTIVRDRLCCYFSNNNFENLCVISGNDDSLENFVRLIVEKGEAKLAAFLVKCAEHELLMSELLSLREVSENKFGEFVIDEAVQNKWQEVKLLSRQIFDIFIQQGSPLDLELSEEIRQRIQKREFPWFEEAVQVILERLEKICTEEFLV